MNTTAVLIRTVVFLKQVTCWWYSISLYLYYADLFAICKKGESLPKFSNRRLRLLLLLDFGTVDVTFWLAKVIA